MLNNIYPLSLPQYEQCKVRAGSIIQKQLGEEPNRQDYLRKSNPLTLRGIILNSLLFLVFLGALAPSSLHIISYMSSQVQEIEILYGLRPSEAMNYLVHQVGYILLAESSLLLFTTTHALSESTLRVFGAKLSLHLPLAIVAASFVFYANLHSGIGFVGSILPPLFTVGGGLILENRFTEWAKNKSEAQKEYEQDWEEWQVHHRAPEKHPDYDRTFNQAIWNSVVGLSRNNSEELANLPSSSKREIVMRERERDLWSDFSVSVVEDRKKEVPLTSSAPKRVKKAGKKKTKAEIVESYLKKHPESLTKSNEELRQLIIDNTSLKSLSLPTLIKVKKSF